MPSLKLFESSRTLLSKDQRLIRLDIDLFQLKNGNVQFERFNFSDHPEAFSLHPQVACEMGSRLEHLPIVLLDDEIVCKGAYPSRQQLAEWTKGATENGGCGGRGCSCGG